MVLPLAAAAPAVSCLGCHPVHHAGVGTCSACHRGDPRSRRKEIAHHDLVAARFAHFGVEGSPVTASGWRAIEVMGCRRCHVTGGKGNRYASDLDQVASRARPDELRVALAKPAIFMPQFALAEGAAAHVVSAVLAGGARAPAAGGEAPTVVHFETRARSEHAFEKRCGGCHRALTAERAGLGAGAVAPNLSGLLTPFYPFPFREGEPWSPARLREWIDNPRKVRPAVGMPPLKITDEERRQVEATLSPRAAPWASAGEP